MRAKFAMWLSCVVLVAVSGVVVAADVVIRSVPYEPAKPAPMVVAKPAPVVERVYPVTIAAGCPCGHALACVGPKGGRYCVNAKGQKKYM